MSKLFKLDFDTTELKLKPETDKDGKVITPTPTELTRRIIGNMIYLYSEQKGGLLKLERNQTYWLQGALKKASEDKLTEIDLPDDIMGFLRKIFRETRAIPDLILQRVEENIDAVKME